MKYEDILYDGFDGARLYARYYRNNESKLCVMCLHGLTRNSRDFDELAEHLSKNYSVIVPDQRGRGRSSWAAPETYNPGAYLRDMVLLLKVVEVDNLVLVGSSMGGLVSIFLTVSLPKLVKGVVLNDIGPEVDARGVSHIKAYLGKNRVAESWSQAVSFCRETYVSGFPEYSNEQWEKFARCLYAENMAGEIALDYDPVVDSVSKNDASSAVPPDLWPLFGQLNEHPLLVVRGENSNILSEECFDKMLDINCNSLSFGCVVSSRAHAPMLNEVQSIDAISCFLQSVSVDNSLPKNENVLS